MPRRKTVQLAMHQRAANLAFSVAHATTIASVCGRLRGHARRCLREKGYRPLDGQCRPDCSQGLQGLITKLEERQKLRLSVNFHLDRAIEILGILDRRNV